MYIIQNVYKVPRRYYVFVFINIFALALKQQIEMNYFGTTEENHQTPMWFSSVSVTAAHHPLRTWVKCGEHPTLRSVSAGEALPNMKTVHFKGLMHCF